MAELLVPSQVMDKKYIQVPEGNVVESDEEWNRCGKWMLVGPPGNWRFVDSSWTALQQLLDDGTLIMLKASTALMAREGALILCYTRPGKQEAKRAAEAIRRVVDFKAIMYYKLNEQTSQGIARRHGDKRVSIYRHMFRGGFYTRKNSTWIKDDEDSDEKTVLNASNFCMKIYSGKENLPSRHPERCFWNLPKDHQGGITGRSYWYLSCSCENEGPYLPDADRVWLVVQQIWKEGLFEALFLRKFENAKFVEMHFYMSLDCDVYSRLTACDRIFKEASCRTVMYFVQKNKTKSFHSKQIALDSQEYGRTGYDFVYTPDGELYRKTEFSEEYLSGYEKD